MQIAIRQYTFRCHAEILILVCTIVFPMACSGASTHARGAHGNDTTAKVTSMNDEAVLAREWVEIREESSDGRIVCRPMTYNIPPARGRRRLDLREQGIAASKSPGADDRLSSQLGGWTVEENILIVTSDGWAGTYRIDNLTDILLVLIPIE